VAEATAVYVPLEWRGVRDEAKRVGVSPRALMRACAAGELRHVRANARGDIKLQPRWTDEFLLSRVSRDGEVSR
jgi:hypothetical protein